MTLKSFIVNEGLKTRSAVALYRYDTLFKAEITDDLVERLFSAWKKLAKKHANLLSASEQEDLKFKSEKALVTVEASKAPKKLMSTDQYGHHKKVAPTLLIPVSASTSSKELIRSQGLAAAKEVFEELIERWSEVFMYELGGKLKSDFKVEVRQSAVMLKLEHADGALQRSSSLFHVAIEHGKIGSKVRDHDTLYLSVDR